jgi:aminoglycoside 6'-N-acetyltransferase I
VKLEAAEAWAVEQAYSEMASAALLDNDVSHEAHKRSGYVEVDRVITYRKPLTERR